MRARQSLPLGLVLLVALAGAAPSVATAGQGKVRRAPSGKTGTKARGASRAHPTRAKAKASRRGTKGQSLRRRRAKFSRVETLERKLPSLRAKMQRALEHPKPDRATAEAAIFTIMDRAYVRVGSERYAGRGENPSFGASSLHKEHVRVRGDRVTLAFPGKSKVKWKKTIVDPALARTIKLFLELPGERLFQYRGAGDRLYPVTATHIREALSAHGVLPKDFRTYHANRLFLEKLAEKGPAKSRAERKKNVEAAIEYGAGQLNHTPGIFQSSYLNPAHKKSYIETGAAGRGPPK